MTPHAARESLCLACHGANLSRELAAVDQEDARVYAHLNQLEDVNEYRAAQRQYEGDDDGR